MNMKGSSDSTICSPVFIFQFPAMKGIRSAISNRELLVKRFEADGRKPLIETRDTKTIKSWNIILVIKK
jgi:hypothetical protein